MNNISYTDYHRDKDYQKFESQFRNIFQKRFNIIKRFVNSGRVLDIGASTGTMIDIFAEHDYETWGVEPSESAKVAAKKGHNIVRCFFEKVDLPENFFDLVIMNHTLEHMDDPTLVLRKVKKILRKNGVVFIDVPNFGGLGSKLLGRHWPYRLPDEHKHQFTREGLTKVLKKVGFKVIYAESRSGIFEYANPFREFFESLFTLKKRFFFNLITIPYAGLATLFDLGDSISFVVKKN